MQVKHVFGSISIMVGSLFLLIAYPAYASTPVTTPKPLTTSTPSASPTPSSTTKVTTTGRRTFAAQAEETTAARREETAVSRKRLASPRGLPRCIWVEEKSSINIDNGNSEPGDTPADEIGKYYYSTQNEYCLKDGEYKPTYIASRRVRLPLNPDAPESINDENIATFNLAVKTTKSIKLPLPTPGMAIRHNDAGTPYVYVNSRVWFWTDPKLYKPVTVRAQAGDTWVEATATPVGLGFNPRKGDPYFECSGPGDVYDFNKNQIDDRAPSGCYYIYKRITHNRTPVEARLNIRWAITWRSNTAQGTLPDMYSTSTPQHYEIGELHNLVVG